MKHIFLLSFFLIGCGSLNKKIDSDFQKVMSTNTGAVVTINLKTNGHVREDKNCSLILEDSEQRHELVLKRGLWDYALPLNQTDSEIIKITCGPFYFHNLQNQGAKFSLSEKRIKYLGIINFKLGPEATLEWGHATKQPFELQERLNSMGLQKNDVQIDLLKL